MTRTTIAAVALTVLVIASGGAAAFHAGTANIDYDDEDLHDDADVGYDQQAEELDDADVDEDDDTDADDSDNADDADDADDSDNADNADNADDSDNADDQNDSDNADNADDSDNADDQNDSDNSDSSDDSDSTDDAEERSADDFSARFTTDVVAGESATLKIVDSSGTPVEGVDVEVDGTGVGTTGADGTVSFQVPDDDNIEVQYGLNGDEKEFTQSVSGASSSDDSSQTNSDMSFSAQFTTDVVAGQDATLKVTYSDGTPVEGATVEVNGNQVGTTNAQGTVTFQVPHDDDGIEVQVAHTGDEQEFTQSVQDA